MKVVFDGLNKLIIINTGITQISVKNDLYSVWKEWVIQDGNSKWLQAFSAIGGEPTTGGKYLGTTYFLINGWKIRTWEGNHRLMVDGNIYSDDGSEIFVPTLGAYNTQINITTSNIVDAISTNGGASYTPEQLAQVIWAMATNTINIDGSIGKLIKDDSIKIDLMEEKVDDIEAIVMTI
jgi:hypothetical protein